MYTLLVLVVATALAAGFHCDSAIETSVGQYWWTALILAYVALFLMAPVRSSIWRGPMLMGVAVLIAVFLYFYDDTLTLYLSGLSLAFTYLLARYLQARQGASDPPAATLITLLSLISIALVLLPVALNRVVVTLPNLSAGTYISVYQDQDTAPGLNGRFFNRIDFHKELVIDLGTQSYFQQAHEAPLLRVDILREKIVLRLIRISYESRLGFFDLPLFSLQGDELMQVSRGADSSPFDWQMDGEMLLVNKLDVAVPAWIQLPHMSSHELSGLNQLVVTVVRILFWLLMILMMCKWSPAPVPVQRR